MNCSKQELLTILDDQKKTIEKYSNKLRDVVAAHKSLLVEKKALEDTIKVLNESKVSDLRSNAPTSASEGVDEEKCDPGTSSEESSSDESKNQINSLLASISKLVSEKSHMEECFKVNQKQLLDDKKAIESRCNDLQDEVKALTKQLKALESKSNTDFFFMKKDSRKGSKSASQKGTSDPDGKSEAVECETLTLQIRNYEKEVKNLRSELEAKRIIHELSEKKLKDYAFELNKLQEEVRNLQVDHQVALQLEKEKAKNVEIDAKKLSAVQEERIVNLETRLAELSETIGSYDRLRLQDQTDIQKLKEHIAHMDMSQGGIPVHPKRAESDCETYDSIAEKILELKGQLQAEALKSDREDDFRKLFPETGSTDVSHTSCKEEYNKMKAEFDFLKNELKSCDNQTKTAKDVLMLQNQIASLQGKIRFLTDKNKSLETENNIQIDQLKKTIKNEKERFKEILAASELDYRGRVWLLEEQLQKQRERSLVLLEEKEQEIESLQSTFQMFLPGYSHKSGNESDESKTLLNQYLDGPHIVHYTNELARKDVEISNLRKSKNQIEMSLKNLKKEIVSIVDQHREETDSFKTEIARLERCQTREGANLEYLKNVVYSFMLSSDAKSKRHMCNAIAAVLKFSDAELQKVREHSKNKWWASGAYM